MNLQFQIYSDLHLELCDSFYHYPKKHETLILAGDIGHIDSPNYQRFIQYCAQTWRTVLYVPGNREFYSQTHSFTEMLRRYRDFFSRFRNIQFLYRRFVKVCGVLFYGTTMWTPCHGCVGKIQSFDQKDECWKDLHSLIAFLHKNNGYSHKVIITHFPIITKNVCSTKYNSQPPEKKRYFSANWLYCFPQKLLYGVKCCVYGHTHYSNTICARGIPCVSNQYGYPDELCDFFNHEGLPVIYYN